MAATTDFQAPTGNPVVRWGLVGLGAALLLFVAWFLYSLFTGVTGIKVQAPPPAVVDMLPPPPPPPPPPPKPQEKPPEPTESPKPAPQKSPQPKAEAPAPMQMNAEAQAGPGSIAAGSGGGSGAPGGTGTCIGANCGSGPPGGGISDAFYGRYLESVLKRRVEAENKLRRAAWSADLAIWLSPQGTISKVEVVRSSGDDDRDALLRQVLLGMSGINTPPASFKFPQRITVKGRKSLS